MCKLKTDKGVSADGPGNHSDHEAEISYKTTAVRHRSASDGHNNNCSLDTTDNIRTGPDILGRKSMAINGANYYPEVLR